MSEFTAGVLFLKPNLKDVEQRMQGFPLRLTVRALNDKWGALFVDGDNYEYPPVKPKLQELSWQIPLLFFQDPEDHGWGYSVYSGGVEIASLWVSYDLTWNLTLDLAKQRYPEVKDYYVQEFWDRWAVLKSEILASSEYHNLAVQQYAKQNLQALQVFGLDAKAIKTLAEATSPDTYFDHETLHMQSQIFKEVLGINEMSWMSYYYLQKRDDSDAE